MDYGFAPPTQIVRGLADLDDGRFEIRPLDASPFYSEFIMIEPLRMVMSQAAALFAGVLKAEAARSRSSATALLARPRADGAADRRISPRCAMREELRAKSSKVISHPGFAWFDWFNPP